MNIFIGAYIEYRWLLCACLWEGTNKWNLFLEYKFLIPEHLGIVVVT